MTYLFDGYDAITDDGGNLIYDGIGKREAEIIIKQLVKIDNLCARLAAAEARVGRLEAACKAMLEAIADDPSLQEELLIAYFGISDPFAAAVAQARAALADNDEGEQT